MVHETSPVAARQAGSSVAEDMAAILGTDIQVAPTPSAAPRLNEAPQGKSHGGSPNWKIAVAAAVLVTTVGAGVLVGKTTLDAPEQVAASEQPVSRQRTAAPARSRAIDTAASRQQPPADTQIAERLAADLSTDAEATSPALLAAVDDRPAPLPERPSDRPSDRPSNGSPAQERRVPYRLAPDIVDTRPSPPADRVASNAPRRADMAPRIEAADAELADAFDRADAAGVPERTLRAYGREWDRAADEAAARPEYALRLYRAITLDVRGLADDTAASERVRRR